MKNNCNTNAHIALSGASGFIGSALAATLQAKGFIVERLVRHPSNPENHEIEWNPATERIDAAALEGMEAVIHLAGENIAKRWTPRNKERIFGSRSKGTLLLASALATLKQKPKVFICASATGYYGSRDGEELTEGSTPGSGFLADVCRAWEAATQPAVEAGIRVVNLRIGMVLSAQGGALTAMLCPFRMNLGSRLGDGRQIMSWITRDDLVNAICFLITDASVGQNLSGPLNAVAPNPVTNSEFTATLCRVLNRRCFLAMPQWALQLALGQMAREVLLSSTRVVPEKLLLAGFPFLSPSLEEALRKELA